MAYSELIKDISRIRDYMREFFVYGFKSRKEIGKKSSRSYDNEKRRIESWLSDYMSFHQDASGKNVFISIDCRHVSKNPLYNAWKASSFTNNDITLHFWLMDILSADEPKSLTEIIDIIDDQYLSLFEDAMPIDESTLRKKLKEYIELGLVIAEKQGKQLMYRLPDMCVNLESWQNAVDFYAEVNPLGVVGSFIQDKIESTDNFFLFKHNYLLFALDSNVMLDLLIAINEQRTVELEIFNSRKQAHFRCTILPLKIYSSVQGGRQYVAAYDMHVKKIIFFRLDSIQKITILDVNSEYDAYLALYTDFQKYLWGVSSGRPNIIEHLEMTLKIEPNEHFVVSRLEREKRCGTVERISDTLWKFSADVYDTQEMLPWIRSFTGRIASFSCSNKTVNKQFKADLMEMDLLYGGNGK